MKTVSKILTGLLLAAVLAVVEAAEVKSLKVLTIGNSFSNSAVGDLSRIVRSDPAIWVLPILPAIRPTEKPMPPVWRSKPCVHISVCLTRISALLPHPLLWESIRPTPSPTTTLGGLVRR